MMGMIGAFLSERKGFGVDEWTAGGLSLAGLLGGLLAYLRRLRRVRVQVKRGGFYASFRTHSRPTDPSSEPPPFPPSEPPNKEP